MTRRPSMPFTAPPNIFIQSLQPLTRPTPPPPAPSPSHHYRHPPPHPDRRLSNGGAPGRRARSGSTSNTDRLAVFQNDKRIRPNRCRELFLGRSNAFIRELKSPLVDGDAGTRT